MWDADLAPKKKAKKEISVDKSAWTDGDLTLDMELKLTVNYQEIREKIYFQVYLEGDDTGACNIEPYLCKEDKDFITCGIIDKLEEKE